MSKHQHTYTIVWQHYHSITEEAVKTMELDGRLYSRSWYRSAYIVSDSDMIEKKVSLEFLIPGKKPVDAIQSEWDCYYEDRKRLEVIKYALNNLPSRFNRRDSPHKNKPTYTYSVRVHKEGCSNPLVDLKQKSRHRLGWSTKDLSAYCKKEADKLNKERSRLYLSQADRQAYDLAKDRAGTAHAFAGLSFAAGGLPALFLGLSSLLGFINCCFGYQVATVFFNFSGGDFTVISGMFVASLVLTVACSAILAGASVARRHFLNTSDTLLEKGDRAFRRSNNTVFLGSKEEASFASAGTFQS